MQLYQPTITGSLSISGSIVLEGPITVISGSVSGTASLAETSSYSQNSERLDNLDSTSFVFTSSYNVDSSSFSTRVTTIESKYATTGSNIFTSNQTICGNLTTTGTITAQTINVQQVTSSIVYSCGSNIFGCAITDTQQFTGSMFITGSNFRANVNNACFQGNICAPSFAFSSAVPATAASTGYLDYSGGGVRLFSVGTSGATKGTFSVYLKGADDSSIIPFSLLNNGIACFACQVCAPAIDIMPSGVGVSTSGGILKVITTGTSTGIGVGQSNSNRYTHIAANDYQVFNDDFFLTTRCAFPLSIGTCYTARLTFAATGEACFRCRVCVPSLTAFSSNITINPSTYNWYSVSDNTFKVLDFGKFGSVYSYQDGACYSGFADNAYFANGTFDWRYKNTQGGSNLFFQDGNMYLETAGTGTAGNTIPLTTKLRVFPCGQLTMYSKTEPGALTVVSAAATSQCFLSFFDKGINGNCLVANMIDANGGNAAGGLTFFVYRKDGAAGMRLISNNIVADSSTGNEPVLNLSSYSYCDSAMTIKTSNATANHTAFGFNYNDSSLFIIRSSGIACFACTVCAKSVSTSNVVKAGDPGLMRGSTVTQSGNSVTFDAFRFLNPDGGVGGAASAVNGRLYMSFQDTATGGNQSGYQYLIFTTGNGVTPGPYCFVQLNCGPVRGTNPISAISIVNDGSGGAVKIQATTAASGVSGAVAYITYVGTAV